MKYNLLLIFLIAFAIAGTANNKFVKVSFPEPKDLKAIERQVDNLFMFSSNKESKGTGKITGTLKLDFPDSLRYEDIDIYARDIETGNMFPGKSENDNKTFVIAELDSGTYNLTFSHEYYDTLYYNNVYLPADSSIVTVDDIDLTEKLKDSYIEVTVEFENNKDGDGQYSDVEIISDIEGLFVNTIDSTGVMKQSLKRGMHKISAHLDHYKSESKIKEINPGDEAKLTLSLEFKNGFITGVVKFDTIFHNSDKIQNVSFILNDIPVADEDIDIKSDGNFIIYYISPANNYILSVEHNHYVIANEPSIKINTNGLDTFKIKNPLILKYNYGEVVVSVENYYQSDNNTDSITVKLTGSINGNLLVYSAQDKEIVFQDLKQEMLTLEVTKDGYIDSVKTINITGGTKNETISLKKTPDISASKDSISFDKQIIINQESDVKNFSISANYLLQDLIVTAPQHFLISENSNDGFKKVLNLGTTPRNKKAIYIIFKPDTIGKISEEVIAQTSYINKNETKTVKYKIAVNGVGLDKIKIKVTPRNAVVCYNTSAELNSSASTGGTGSFTFMWEDLEKGEKGTGSTFVADSINKMNYQVKLTVTDDLENTVDSIILIDHYDLPTGVIVIKGIDSKILIYSADTGYQYEWYNLLNPDTKIGNLQYYSPPGGDENGVIWPEGDYFIKLTNGLGCEYYSDTISGTDLKSAMMKFALLNNQELFENLMVYPNPTNDKINIFSNELIDLKIKSILVIDAFGRTIIRKTDFKNFNSSQIELSLKGQTPGIYFIQISGEEKSLTQKIILK